MGRRRFGAPPVAVAVVAVVVLVAAGLSFWSRITTPTDLTDINTPESVRWTARGVVTLRDGAPGGLLAGDRVVAVEGRSMQYWVERLLDLDAKRPSFAVGATLTYRVERDGRLLDIPVTLQPYPLASRVAANWNLVLVIVVLVALAIFIFVCRPDHLAARAGLLLASFAACATTSWMFGLEVGDLVTARGLWRYVLGETADVLVWATLLHFVLVFPRPRTVLIRHPSLIGLVYAAPFVVHGTWLAAVLPTASDTLERVRLWMAPIVLEFVYPVVLLAALVHGYRSMKDDAARQRLRWLAVTLGAALSLYLVIWVALPAAVGRALLPPKSHFLIFLPALVAVAVAILRYQAFEIKVVIHRALVYGFLTACVVGIYVTTVELLSTVFQQAGWSTSRSFGLIATGLVAVLLGPLRQWLQRGVNRLLYGERDEPYEVISRLGQRLEATLAPTAVLQTVVETITQALRLPYAAIELKHGDGFKPEAVYGQPAGKLLRLPLTYHGATIGQLVVAPRGPNETFSTADRRLLEDLARQTCVAVHSVRLTVDLQRSRQQLVTAREEERRRLRRDLHDGIGATLASIALGLDAVGNTLRSNPTAAEQLLQQLRTGTQTAVSEVRRLAYDLRPPALDQLGLAHALRMQAANLAHETESHRMQVTVQAPAKLTGLPAAVEVAAYRIALEAIINAARHAHAHACTVRLALNGGLELEVSDDGDGLPAHYRAGVGITSMHERAAELGGTCAVEPAPGGGTTVRARLPLPESE